MSIELVARAKKTRLKGDSTTKLLLIVLADYANDDRQAWPSVTTLAAEVEVGDRTIQRSLRKLEDMGLIGPGDQRLTKGYPKGQKPVVYQVFPDHKRRRRTGVTHDTGVTTTTGDTTDTPTGDTHDTTPATPMTPPRCHPSADTGDTHVTQTVMEPPIQPSRESTRTRKREKTETDDIENRIQRLNAFTPTSEHRQLADRYGVDCDWELRKFVNQALANGKPPYDPGTAFNVWLDRARELAIGKPPALPDGASDEGRELERARKLVTTSIRLQRRYPSEATRMAMIRPVARLFAKGADAKQVMDLLTTGSVDELARAGIVLDDVEAVA